MSQLRAKGKETNASHHWISQEFLCNFSVSLEADELKTVMIVKNEGTEESFDFQAALHSYFTVSSLENLEVTGSFEGKEFLNKLVGDEGEMQTEDRSIITITEEYDRVYKGVNDPVLKDSGTGKAVSFVLVEFVGCDRSMSNRRPSIAQHFEPKWMGRYCYVEPLRRWR